MRIAGVRFKNNRWLHTPNLFAVFLPMLSISLKLFSCRMLRQALFVILPLPSDRLPVPKCFFRCYRLRSSFLVPHAVQHALATQPSSFDAPAVVPDSSISFLIRKLTHQARVTLPFLPRFLVPHGVAAAGHGVQAAGAKPEGFFCGVGAPLLL